MSDLTIAQRGHQISQKAAMLGFDWDCAADVLDKLIEEIGEIRSAMDENDSAHVREEVGDLFFALINFNRKMHIDSDSAFEAGVAKFERRFQALENIVSQSGRQIGELSMSELEAVWQRVKKEEHHAT